MYDKQHFGDLVSVSFLWHLKIKRYRPGSRSQRPAGAVGCQSTVFKFKFRFKLLSPPFKPELKLKLAEEHVGQELKAGVLMNQARGSAKVQRLTSLVH